MYKELHQKIIFKKLDGPQLLIALRDKLVEESAEIPVLSTDRNEIIDEIGDVEQVLADLKSRLSISDREIYDTKQRKFLKKGGFSDGIFVEAIELKDDDEWVDYYRKEPSKYIELSSSGHTNPDIPSLEPGVYLHAKSGKKYEVIGTALNTETNAALVVYCPLYDSKYELFVRPYEMFIETVMLDGKKVPRFEKIDN